MNDVLKLKGKFEQKPSSSRPRGSHLPKGKSVTAAHLQELLQELQTLYSFWEQDKFIKGALVSILYPTVIAKSNRIHGFFAHGATHANDSIVGARFEINNAGKHKHVITHFISLTVLSESIKFLTESLSIVKNIFNNKISSDDINKLYKNEFEFTSNIVTKTKFITIIVDAYNVEKFFLNKELKDITEDAIITIYKTGVKTNDLLESLGIELLPGYQWDEHTMLLTPDQFKVLKDKAPYLIAMSVSDLSQIGKDDFQPTENNILSIPNPANEPVIGVIDTLFDRNVYFSKWVESKNMLDKDILTSEKSYFHGTAVTSIIVDGPSFNPELNDGCGRFRVKHFGVTTEKPFSSFSVLKSIQQIVQENPKIRVWNLSLGSIFEINPNFVSPEAAILDQIQYKNDVLFVISGTNKVTKDNKKTKIGAPADSINALVVNSVKKDGQPAWYSRYGSVLSFYNKPDVSYYGGEKGEYIRVCTPTGESLVSGTSYAAPWIARKMAYLIEVIGLSREVAKAMLIDAATGWNTEIASPQLIGYGIVPIRIEDIIQSKNDEIKFVITGVSEKYDTYNYKLPVPIFKDKYPFIARATLCYFPSCSRSQGVDYTSTELDVYFGRVTEKGIKSINSNKQSTNEVAYITEEEARSDYRKWDNVKHINETIKTRSKPKKVYENKMWGLSIKAKERIENKLGRGMKFGIVITLKELNGVNRINEFIQQCQWVGWIVDRINVENRLDIHTIAETEIEFE